MEELVGTAALDAAIREGLDEVERNFFHALGLPDRRRLWRAFGPSKYKVDGRAYGPGLIRRTNLAIEAVQYVIPIWEDAFPKKAGPDKMISLARGILDGKYGEEVQQESDSFEVASQNLGYDDREKEAAAVVGTAASRLIVEALYDVNWGEPPESPNEEDEDLDPDIWDSSYFVAIAAANGPFGDPRSNNDARRAFWQWYLREAAPRAYQTARDSE